MKKVFLYLFLVLGTINNINAQVVYEHISNTTIYTFLDELANIGIIDLARATKPYDRVFIAQKLIEAKGQQDKLTQRQKKEIDFYLQSYKVDLPEMFENKFGLLDVLDDPKWATSINPLGGFYKDSSVTMTLKPILGYQIWNNENGSQSHRWSGIESYGYFGKHLAFYASLRDNVESEWFSEPQFLARRTGSAVKRNWDGEQGQVAYTEMRGGITYDWNWGNAGVVKDHVQWGTGYAGTNIFSGRTPSFTMLQLNLRPVKWFEFNFYNGWLVSGVVDSVNSYYGNDEEIRTVFRQKNIAANLFSFYPWQHTRLSFGNAIVYSDMGSSLVYFNPFMFYKSIDHTYNAVNSVAGNNGGQNASMFVEFSTRALHHFHFYSSLYIDEISMSKIFDQEEQTSMTSWKVGMRTNNLLPNLSFTAEYTRTRPWAFKHYINTTTYESNSFNLGHYLTDNAQDIYLELAYKPIRGLHLLAAYNLAQKGPELLNDANSNRGLVFMETVEWEKKQLFLKASYEIINNAFVFLEYQSMDVTGDETYTPEYFFGKTNTISVGFNNNF